MRVAIVTGSGGLVGSESVRALVEEGYHVVGLENDTRARLFGASASTQGPGNAGENGSRAPVAKRFVGVVALLSLLPLLLRFGGLIVRGIAVAVREIAEGLTLIRGTPFVLAVVVLALPMVSCM